MPAHLLILDLSSSLYVGIWDGSKVAASRVRPQGTRGEAAHALVDECLAEAGIGPEGLAAVAAGTGPGSFTGIRVCGALALGLAFARRLPVHPFSSLAAIEACIPGAAPRAVSAIAANAGRWYARRRGGEESLISSDALLALGGPDATLAVSGEAPGRDRLAEAFGSILSAEERYDFARVAALAMASPPAPDGTLRPNYLSASAAEDKLRAGLLGARGGAPGAAAGTSP